MGAMHSDMAFQKLRQISLYNYGNRVLRKLRTVMTGLQGKTTPEVIKSITYSGDMTLKFLLGISANSSYATLALEKNEEIFYY